VIRDILEALNGVSVEVEPRGDVTFVHVAGEILSVRKSGNGSTFTFEFPVDPAERAAVGRGGVRQPVRVFPQHGVGA
jgi:hypothetical protein